MSSGASSPGLSPTDSSSAVNAITAACGDPTRRRSYLCVHESTDGVTATEVATEFDVHPNVARHHLDKLAGGGHLEVAVDRTGSGAHMHYHLANAETGRNVFTGESDRRGLGLSETAYHFLGGVLAHARALCAVTSPTVNCFKRLQVGQALTVGGQADRHDRDGLEAGVQL